MKIPFKYHTESFAEIAAKNKEPKESLEELLKRYETASRQYMTFMEKLRECQNRYRRMRINRMGQEEYYIDYDTWEKEDLKSFLQFGLGSFNGFSALDMMEEQIDTKIYYLNQREEQN